MSSGCLLLTVRVSKSRVETRSMANSSPVSVAVLMISAILAVNRGLEVAVHQRDLHVALSVDL